MQCLVRVQNAYRCLAAHIHQMRRVSPCHQPFFYIAPTLIRCLLLGQACPALLNSTPSTAKSEPTSLVAKLFFLRNRRTPKSGMTIRTAPRAMMVAILGPPRQSYGSAPIRRTAKPGMKQPSSRQSKSQVILAAIEIDRRWSIGGFRLR